MKRLLIIFIILVAAFLLYWFKFRSTGGDSGPKQQPLAVKKHSLQFNTSVVNAMSAYFDMKNAFVEADTTKAKNACKNFLALLDSIHLDELKKDTASIFETAQANLNDVKANAVSLMQQTDIAEMRQDFRMVSEMLYPSFFSAINYEGPKMYWQSCPMAFGEGKEGNWISNTVEVVNPYANKNDAKSSVDMEHCGEIKDTIKTK
ncbi:MAG: DUF3347 domain-containing protein [Bacteroidetes bacterium]|nr:DUF3347 domain-containing protein [Bacteroidota bacterium]